MMLASPHSAQYLTVAQSQSSDPVSTRDAPSAAVTAVTGAAPSLLCPQMMTVLCPRPPAHM